MYYFSIFTGDLYVKLMLITDGDKRHYTLIKSMSRLLSGLTKHNEHFYVIFACIGLQNKSPWTQISRTAVIMGHKK